MLLIKKSPAYACLLLIVLFLTSGLSYAVPPAQFNITATQKGSGTVSPSGKVAVFSGQDQPFTFQPSEGFEVSSVKVDGYPVIPAPISYTFSQVTKAHTLSVTFALKTVEIHLINQSLQMGSMQPAGTVFKAPYGSKQTFTVKPKKGYLAIMRLDGNEVKRGDVNKQISYEIECITPHTIDVRYEAENNKAVTATVHVNAIDYFTKTNAPLHYQWKVSEGQIENLDQDTVQWTLPVGPGVHFANVLVSNNQGGYAARRIAVITDNLGTSPPVIKDIGQDFEPTSAFGKSYAYDSIFVVTETTDAQVSKLLDRFIYLRDFIVLDPTIDGLASDSQGRIIATPLDVNHGGDLVEPPNSSTATHPHTHTNSADYIVGSVQLADGSLCGTDDKFHGVDVTATTTAVDSANNPLPLGNPVTVKANAYGDYALPLQSDAYKIRIECESAPSLYVTFDDTTRIAEKAVFLKTGQPIITPKAGSMTAKINNRNVGIFLPPELKQPSDLHPSGDKFLGFKGMDTQQQACEYYKSIGAVQDCDLQGNPTGAIIFDDWKRKVQMEPYATQAGKEVDATYVNRIDLNLTRRHHAISYDDQPEAVYVSASDSYTCALRSDKSLACWGDNYNAVTSPSDGNFSQVTTGSDHGCAIKTEDGSVLCWGAKNDGQPIPTDSFKQISAGSGYTCGIKSADNTLACWGWGGEAALPPTGSFSQISAGSSHTCGIKTDGTVMCWGYSYNGETSPPGDVFSQISTGNGYTCGIKSADDTVACWGNIDQTTIPSEAFSQLSAGAEHICGIKKTDQTVACWGNVEKTKIINPESTGAFLMDQYNNGLYSCGTKTDNTEECWSTPPPVGNFTQISAGRLHTCGIKTDGTLSCWGNNNSGEASPPNFKHRVAAYVCNHLGPKTSTRRELEWAISNAVNDRNQVACVAMDYQSHNGGNPYVRFYVFTANGQLSLSINLDGRQEKYVPGTCVACHGGDKYDGHFPGNGTGSPDVGAHFLPYDIGNFLFSAQSGLKKADQQAAIHKLNNIVLQTNATKIEKTLINSWYKSGTDILDEYYWPDDWQKAAKDPTVKNKLYPALDIEHMYKDVNARYCRTCHVALSRDGMGSGGHIFDNPEYFDKWANILFNYPDPVPFVSPSETAFPLTVCGNSPYLRDNHAMPNSLVTFNLLWNDKKAVKLLQGMLSEQTPGQTCKAETPNPALGILQ